MWAYLVRRSIRTLLTLWGVSTLVFVILHLSGDPVALMLPQDAPTAEIVRVRQEMGLDQPLIVQYGVFMGKLLQGDFGASIHLGRPAMEVVLERLPATLELATASMVLATVVAIPLGMIAAIRRQTAADRIGMLIAMVGQSAPVFYIGILMILIFTVQLHLLPSSGRGSWSQLVMPAATLGFYSMATMARITRSSMLDVLDAEYVRTARAKGLRERVVILRHVLQNASIPIITVMGLQLGSLLGGAVITETIFAWPGLGRLAIQSISNRDYPVVQAAVFVGALFFVIVNFIVDVLYGVVNPRVRNSD